VCGFISQSLAGGARRWDPSEWDKNGKREKWVVHATEEESEKKKYAGGGEFVFVL